MDGNWDGPVMKTLRVRVSVPRFPSQESNLKMFEAKMGPVHPDTIVSRNNLAGLYLNREYRVRAAMGEKPDERSGD